METTGHLSLKVKLGDDIRRFSVPKDVTFSDLHHLVAKHFVLAPETMQLKYIDDEEELITLGSDLELHEAKRLQPTVLRLNVYCEARPKTGETNRLEASFVRDVTVPDGVRVTAGVKFRKVWCVKNSGTESWPRGILLKMVDPKDEQLLVLAAGTINRPVAPGEECDIGVELQAPSRVGRCVQYWRLFTEDGEAFGRRLWVDINVTPLPQATLLEDTHCAEEKAKAQREEEEIMLLQEEARIKAEFLRKQQEEEQRRIQQEAEEEQRRIQQEAEEEQRRVQQQQEEEQRRIQQEAERLQEEKRRLAAEQAEQRRLQEEARLKQQQQEEELKRKNSKYPAQLTALAEMGFTDVDKNVRLLDKHHGNLDLALEALLTGH